MFETIARHEETGLGLPYPIVLVDSAEREIDDTTGDVVGVSVPDLEQLVVSVAVVRVLQPVQMAGEEIKFVRQVLGMTATALAEELTIDKSTYSRWENGKQECGEWMEKQVRQIAVIKLARLVTCLSVDPTAIVGMRIRRAIPGQWPHIEMRRVAAGLSVGCGDGPEAWDAMPLAIAA